MVHLDLNGEKRGGGLIFGWMYARGGGVVIQMRTVCNRGGGGSKNQEKMRT